MLGKRYGFWFRSVVGVPVGVALEVPATFGLAFERAAEPAGISAGGVARNRRGTVIRIRSAHRQIHRPPKPEEVCDVGDDRNRPPQGVPCSRRG